MPANPDPSSDLPDTTESVAGLTADQFAKCRARYLAGDVDLVDCLADWATTCPYALGFGFGYFCRHLRRNEIVARTAAETSSAQPPPVADEPASS